MIISIYLHINIFCFSYDTGNKSTKGRDQNTIFRIGGPASFLSYCKKLIFYKYIKTSPKVRARCGEITSITRSTSSGTCCPSPPLPGRGSPSSSWWRSSWSMSEKQTILKNVSTGITVIVVYRFPAIASPTVSIFSAHLFQYSQISFWRFLSSQSPQYRQEQIGKRMIGLQAIENDSNGQLAWITRSLFLNCKGWKCWRSLKMFARHFAPLEMQCQFLNMKVSPHLNICKFYGLFLFLFFRNWRSRETKELVRVIRPSRNQTL